MDKDNLIDEIIGAFGKESADGESEQVDIYQCASELYEKGEYEAEAKLWYEAAKRGDAHAQY